MEITALSGSDFDGIQHGMDLGNATRKTNRQYQGQTIYVAETKIGEDIKRGDLVYLDGAHKNHLEVFDQNRNFKVVLNLDGTRNLEKTAAAEGRKLPK